MKKLLFVCILFWCANASAATYYISNDGSNDNDGLSMSEPWADCTMIDGVTTFAPGDQILFRYGDTWLHTNEINFNSSGTIGNPIYIGAYSDDTEGHTVGDAKPIISTWNQYTAGTWEEGSFTGEGEFTSVATSSTSGGYLTVTSESHGLSNGDLVNIETTNSTGETYRGVWKVFNKTDNTFDIYHSFVSGTGSSTGTYSHTWTPAGGTDIWRTSNWSIGTADRLRLGNLTETQQSITPNFVSSTLNWCKDVDSRVYVYCEDDPYTTYNPLGGIWRATSGSMNFVVSNSADYVTIENIDFRGYICLAVYGAVFTQLNGAYVSGDTVTVDSTGTFSNRGQFASSGTAICSVSSTSGGGTFTYTGIGATTFTGVSGLEASDNDAYIYQGTSTGIEIKNCRFFDISGYAVYMNFVTNSSIHDCEFDRNIQCIWNSNQGDNLGADDLALWTGSQNNSFYNNTFQDPHHGQVNFLSNLTVTEGQVCYNLFYDNVMNVSTPPYYNRSMSTQGKYIDGVSTCHHNYLYNNLTIGQSVRAQILGTDNYYFNNIWINGQQCVYTQGGNGVSQAVEFEEYSGYISKDNYFVNNTIIGSWNEGIYFSSAGTASNNIVANNIILNNGQDGTNYQIDIAYDSGQNNFGGSGNKIENNFCYPDVIHYGSTTGDISTFTADHSSDFSVVSGNYTTDPLVTSEGRLYTTSPAIGAGVNTYSGTIGMTTDYLGHTRPNTPSIGAYEYISVETENVAMTGVTIN